MPEFYDSKRIAIMERIAAWKTTPALLERTAKNLSFTDLQRTAKNVSLADLQLTHEQAERIMWDTAGRWVFPWDPEYDELRLLYYNNFHNVFPIMIAACETAYDVSRFINFARKRPGLRFTPRSGGHSTAGFSGLQGGIMLDLRGLDNMMVDPTHDLIHVGPGVQFRDFYKELETYGLFTPAGICPDVRVGGYMQGGGYGFGSRMMGINCDNVTNLYVVLASGRMVQANQQTNADLYWAMRGGTGNNFGIVTQVTYRVERRRQFGAIAMRWCLDTDEDAENAAKAMVLMQTKFMGSNDDRRFGYMPFIQFLTEKGRQIPYLLMRTMYHGPEGLGSKILNELIATPGCEVEWEETGSYLDLNNKLMGYEDHENKTQFVDIRPEDLPFQEKQSRFFDKPLGYDGWRKTIDHMRDAPRFFSSLPELNIEAGGGAINDTKRGENAYIHRNDDFNAFLNTYHNNEKEREAAFAFMDKWLEISEPFSNGEAYQNYPKPYLTNWSERYWAEYYPAMCLIKKKYDPTNLFTFEQGIGADGKCLPDQEAIEKTRALRPELAENIQKPIEYFLAE